MTTHNISLSGDKDSTATLLVAIALEAPNLHAVFADIQYDLMITTDAQACSSAYGLCDTDPELVKTPEAA